MKRFFANIDPDKKSAILRYTGIAVLVFTFFTLLSALSYLFTWQADQSLLSDPSMMSKGVDVANWGGKLGYRWSRFLVSDCFGLGSFALVFLMGAVAYRLFFWNRSIGLLKTTFITVSGTFVSSMVLSYLSMAVSSDTAFGGGLGGDAGHAVVAWLSNLTGPVVTALILIAVSIAWLLLTNKRFAGWFATVGEGLHSDEVPTVAETPAEEEQPEEEEEPEYEPEPVVVTEPEPELDPEPLTPEDVAVLEPIDADTEVLPEGEPAGEDSGMEVIMGGDFTDKVTEDLPRIDNREELQRFKFPPLDLLKDYADGQHKVSQQELDINNNRIRATLQNYRIEVDRVTAVVGPTVTLYKVVPSAGVRVSAIESLHREIAMALGASGVRVVTLPDCVGIEVPNNTPSIVPLKSMLNDDSFRNSKAELPIAIGYTITQEVKTFDLTDAPHLLVAGATKQGKSVGLNVIIASLLYAKHPTELKFVFIDPKMVEFTAYNSLLKH